LQNGAVPLAWDPRQDRRKPEIRSESEDSAFDAFSGGWKPQGLGAEIWERLAFRCDEGVLWITVVSSRG
jgi:hypothetical protein